MIRLPKLKTSWRQGKQYTSPVTLGGGIISQFNKYKPRDILTIEQYLRNCENKTFKIQIIYVYSRGVSDVGFPVFADTDADADFAF